MTVVAWMTQSFDLVPTVLSATAWVAALSVWIEGGLAAAVGADR